MDRIKINKELWYLDMTDKDFCALRGSDILDNEFYEHSCYLDAQAYADGRVKVFKSLLDLPKPQLKQALKSAINNEGIWHEDRFYVDLHDTFKIINEL